GYGGSGGSGGYGGSGGSGGSGGEGGNPSMECGPNLPCADGSPCVQSLGHYYCTQVCSAPDLSCSPYYTCVPNLGACFKSEQCDNDVCAPGLVCVDNGGKYCTTYCDSAGGCPLGYACDAKWNVCFKSSSPGCGPYNDCGEGKICVDDRGKYCTTYCDAAGACPAGYACAPDSGVCFRQRVSSYDDDSTTSSSCAMTGRTLSGSLPWTLVGFAAGLIALRRRQRACATDLFSG
ncbi:MAG TPA: hypothetical protein PKK83_20185, partial [Polyangiaceae bacterium]|nr:hypothetical protein [Polyangiaceae bacterium]